MRAARKQADPQMAFIVPVKTHARWWRRAGAEAEVRLLNRRLWIPARGRQSIPSGRTSPWCTASTLFPSGSRRNPP
jgi:hypothetical protein